MVFEETHTSRAGQLEIALMLMRLHDQHKLRHISLEGAVFDKGELPAKWFHDLPDSKEAVQEKERVAVQLLGEGEISSAEFMALTFPDTQVRGNETAEEYNVEMSKNSSAAPLYYLVAIAEKSATQTQIRQFNGLMQEKKQKEALDLLLRADPWVYERYQKLTDRTNFPSSEELIVIYKEIEAKADSGSAQIDAEARSGMRDAKNFFVTASKRSCTMVRNTLAMCDAAPKSPVALIIGAAHTAKVVELLKAGKVSYAVISPNSLVEKSERGDLLLTAYDRKLEQQSVDAPGLLGAFLSARRKPTSILDKQWFQAKAELYLIARLLANAAAGGDKPPFKNLDAQLNALTAIKVDPASYQVVKVGDQNRVLFKVTARIDDANPNRTVDIWGGGWKQPPGPPPINPPNSGQFSDPDDGKRPVTLEGMLEEKLELVKQEGDFIISEQSLTDLRYDGIPESVLQQLQTKMNQVFVGEAKFLAALNPVIGEAQLEKFKSKILEHTKQTKDRPPTEPPVVLISKNFKAVFSNTSSATLNALRRG